MLEQLLGQVGGPDGHVPGPAPEAAVLVDRLHPLGQVAPLGAVLGRVLPLHLKHELRALAELDQEVGPAPVDAPLPDVDHLEAQVVVLGPGDHVVVVVQREGLGRLPRAVVDAEVDVGALGVLAGLGRVPSGHVPGAAQGALTIQHQLDE